VPAQAAVARAAALLVAVSAAAVTTADATAILFDDQLLPCAASVAPLAAPKAMRLASTAARAAVA
jgi:hypothetical protein